MNFNELNFYILSLIIENISDTKSYAALRQTCQYFYFLMPNVKRFTNGVLTEQINYYNHQLNGEHICFYDSGKLKSISLYDCGIILTRDICWEENGRISVHEMYKKNKKSGKQLYFDLNGYKEKAIEYENDKPHGKEVSFFQSGLIKSIGSYIRGKKNGMEIHFNETGIKILTKQYQNNFLSGESQIFYDDGTMKQITNFTLGMKNGLTKFFDQNGNLKLELNYKNNLKHGKLREWKFQNGMIVPSLECYFKNGILDGQYKKYFNGIIFFECFYSISVLDGPAVIYNFGQIEFETYFNMGKIDFYHKQYVNNKICLNVLFNEKKEVVVFNKFGKIECDEDIHRGKVYWAKIMEKYKIILKNKLDISYILD